MSNQEFVVKVGDTDLRIARFKGLKAVLAMALSSRVMRELPEIQERVDQYVQNYRKSHTVTLTPAMAKMPRFFALGLQAEDFAASGGTIEWPDEPAPQQLIVAMVPELFDLARVEVMRFLALVAIPNSELEEADDNDNVEEALDKLGKKLLRQGDIDELLELAVAGWEVMQDQIQSKKDKLGKLMDLPFLRALRSMQDQNPSEEIPQTLTPDAPISSTPLPPDTDGQDAQRSTVSPGVS